MYVETGIPLRIPYRQTFTMAGANADMMTWNQYCNVNWSAYKFNKLNGHGPDPGTIVVDKFYIDVDVYEGDVKVNTESAPRLEEMLEKGNVARLWVSTEHGFNCYVKAPPGCGTSHVESLFLHLQSKGIDVDPCMVDPLAQRKAIGSYIHENGSRVTPLTGEEVLGMDIDTINEQVAKRETRVPKDYWTGVQPFSQGTLCERVKHVLADVNVNVDGWKVNSNLICPVIHHVAGKTRPSFFERLDLLKYLKVVAGVHPRDLEQVAISMIGEEEWKIMSGHKHLVMMAARCNMFSPVKLRLKGLCPAACDRCSELAEKRDELEWVIAYHLRGYPRTS